MILRFPPPDKPWSVNEIPPTVSAKIRRSKQKATWRDAAFYEARKALGPGWRRDGLPPSTVTVQIPFPTNRRRDPHNYVGTVVKAIIDGMVLAGCWPDDNPDYVTVIEPKLTVGREVVVITERRDHGVCVVG